MKEQPNVNSCGYIESTKTKDMLQTMLNAKTEFVLNIPWFDMKERILAIFFTLNYCYDIAVFCNTKPVFRNNSVEITFVLFIFKLKLFAKL